MADFVGLLKKTIEAQSQMTPQLRQRIYERARATVERKLTESQAPAPVVERQFEILNRAIDEVESFYQQSDGQDIDAATLDEEADSTPDDVTDPADSASSTKLPEHDDFVDDQSAQESLGHDEPDQEGIIQDQTVEAEELPHPSAIVVEEEASLTYPPFADDPLEKLVQPSSQPSDVAEEVPEKVRQNIPSLASLLNAETKSPLQDSALLSPDLPFLPEETALEEQQPPLSAVQIRKDFTSLSSLPDYGDSLTVHDRTADDELLSQLPLADPIEELPPDTVSSLEVPDHPGEDPSTEENLPKSTILEDYLPRWTENAQATNRPTVSTTGQEFDTSDFAALPPFPLDQQRSDPVGVIARESVESEIDRARHEIEVLRTGETLADEPPFLSDFPIDPPVDLPIESMSAAGEPTSSSMPERPGSEADFDNDLVSEIFVQAARREQKQSNKRQRAAAFVIATIVLAVLAAIIGVLVITNEYQVASKPDETSKNVDQATLSTNDNGRSNDAPGNGATSDTIPPKITKRLLPDGQESDPGPAVEAAKPGEGSSQANASLPTIDNSARAIFYEAPMELLSATANEGQVEWSLRRTSVPVQAGDDQSEQGERQELAIIGDVKIPDLGMTLRLTVRRNHDETVPADYLTEIIFVLPDDFDGEVIDEVGPLLFKAAEQSTGQELAGTVTAKVRDNLFLMAIRAPRPILDRNLALMRQLPWLKLNVLYKNGRVGEFSIAKGEGGNRLFQQAIDEWSRQANTRLPAPSPVPQPSSQESVPQTIEDAMPSATTSNNAEME